MQTSLAPSRKKPLFVFKPSMVNRYSLTLYNQGEEVEGSYLNIKKTIHELGLERIFAFDDGSKTFSYLGPWQYIKFAEPLLSIFGKCFTFFTLTNIKRGSAMSYLAQYCPEEESCYLDDSQKLRVLEQESEEFFRSAVDLKDKEEALNFNAFISRNLCIGEDHRQSCSKRFIIENMEIFASYGYKTLFLEHLFYDSAMQESMNLYIQDDCEIDAMPKDLKQYLIALGEKFCLSPSEKYNEYNEKYNFFTLVRAAKQYGLRLVGIDTVESYKMGMSSFGSEGEERMRGMNYEAKKIIEKESRGKKFIALMGNNHISERCGVLGVSQIIPNSIAVDIYFDKSEEPKSTFEIRSSVIGEPIKSEVKIACKIDSSLTLTDLGFSTWPHQKEEAKPTIIYRPVFATGYWAQVGHRRNDFRAIDGLYEIIDIVPLKRLLLKEAAISGLESKEEKIKFTMISNVIRAAVDSELVRLNEDGGFDCNNIVMALLKAKTQGGIANKVIPLEGIESNYQERIFSQLVQKYNKESGIFSGRVENLKSGDATQFGLRATFLPHNVINFFEQKNREKSSIDRDALQC